ncbi:MAG: helix-turn-helix domain-containing protein [bacterium]
MEIFNQLYMVAFFQAIFFILLILSKKGKQPKDYLLAFFVFLLALECLNVYVYDQLGFKRGWFSSYINIFIWTLLGPLIYLYIKSVIQPEFKLSRKSFLHFLPMLFTYITLAHFLYLNKENMSFRDLVSIKNGILVWTGMKVWEYTVNVYYLAAIVLLIRHRKRIKHYFSTTVKPGLSWLLYLTIGFAVYLYFGMVDLLLVEYTDILLPAVLFYFSSIIIFLYIFGIGYFGYRQENIFSNAQLSLSDFEKISKNVSVANLQKYRKSGLHEDEHDFLKKRLNEYMSEEKPYIDSELTINELSEKLNTTIHKLSQVLNESFNQNFYDFVNSYRVEEIKKKLNDPNSENYKILSLAYESGFNSKTTFYTAFKKATGVTPLQYKERYLQTSEIGSEIISN